MDRHQLCNSLITWLQTFGIDGTQSLEADKLCDGVIMSQALHQIAPIFFNDVWMSKLKRDVGTNWRLKVSNLKKIIQGVLNYYSETLGQQLQDFEMPDVNAIGEHGSQEDLSRLLQLILGCAIHCDTKEDYIQNIRSLEESVQHNVMNAIKELMSKEVAIPVAENVSAEQIKKLTEELSEISDQKEQIFHRCHELDLQVATLQEEKANLLVDNERLNERVNASDSMDDPSTPIGRRFQQLSNQVEQLQEDLYRLEAARDDYRLKVEVQYKEIQELNQKNENLNEFAEEARTLKDEIDVLRHTQDKVEKYETTIEMYKKKLDEMQDLKGQIKVLEEKNINYMDTNVTLEEELRKCQSVRSQMELYKRQMTELQTRCSEETRRADRAEFEVKRSTEKISALQREKERILNERDILRESNEELQCTQVQKDSLLGDANNQLFDDANLDLASLPPALRERIIRLQHENKILKQDRNNADQAEVLQTLLDDAQKRSNELQSEVRISNQRIMELEAQIEDFTESSEKYSASDQATASNLRAKLNSAQQTITKQQQDIVDKSKKVEEIEATLNSNEKCTSQLRQQIQEKDKAMKEMEDKYKRYLDKAKSVIQTLDPKNKPGPAPEVQALRNQLQEKERLIDHIEKDHERAKQIREQEEKMMVSAWYNLGLKLHRQAAEERLDKGHPARQSFLSRQRQAHTRRSQSNSTVHNASPNITR